MNLGSTQLGNREIGLRRAGNSDATTIARFLRLMVVDMEQTGGRPAAPGDASWEETESGIPARLQDDNRLYVIAELGDAPVGFGEAKHTGSDPIYLPKSIVKISSLYVTPEYRRKGVGSAILSELLLWGRDHGCSEAELDVLVDNPARELYAAAGFADFEVRMRRNL